MTSCDPHTRPGEHQDPSGPDVALTQVLEAYLVCYLLPANVAAYYQPANAARTQDTDASVAARCAPLMAAKVLESDWYTAALAGARRTGVDEARSMIADAHEVALVAQAQRGCKPTCGCTDCDLCTDLATALRHLS